MGRRFLLAVALKAVGAAIGIVRTRMRKSLEVSGDCFLFRWNTSIAGPRF
jgi:hypothetical protein